MHLTGQIMFLRIRPVREKPIAHLYALKPQNTPKPYLLAITSGFLFSRIRKIFVFTGFQAILVLFFRKQVMQLILKNRKILNFF